MLASQHLFESSIGHTDARRKGDVGESGRNRRVRPSLAQPNETWTLST